MSNGFRFRFIGNIHIYYWIFEYTSRLAVAMKKVNTLRSRQNGWRFAKGTSIYNLVNQKSNILSEVQLKSTLFQVISSMQQTSDWTYDSKIQSMYVYVCMSVSPCFDVKNGHDIYSPNCTTFKICRGKWPSCNTIFRECGNIARCQLSSSLLPCLRDCD